MLTINENGLDLDQIAPKCGAKYSANLHRWLTSKNHPTRSWASRVYRDTRDILWIGILDGRELFGTKLIAVLCNGASEPTAAWQNIDAVEVPDFWAQYTLVGRCAIDLDHSMMFVDDKTRWSVTNDVRACTWCKASQHLKRWTENVERQEWVNTPQGLSTAVTPESSAKTFGDLVSKMPLFSGLEWGQSVLELPLESACGMDCAKVLRLGNELASSSADMAQTIVNAVERQINIFYFG